MLRGAAVKVDLVEVDAAIARLRLWELHGNRLCTAALGILDDRAPSLARAGVRASSAVSHVIVEYDVHISINFDMVLGWREGRGWSAGEAGPFAGIGCAADAVAAKGIVTRMKRITLSLTSAGAGEAGEAIIIVLAEVSSAQVIEVPAGLLEAGTLVVGILRASKRWSRWPVKLPSLLGLVAAMRIDRTYSHSLLGKEARDDGSSDSLHRNHGNGTGQVEMLYQCKREYVWTREDN
jgi:hypothetical protein